ncbi:gagpol and env protein precursor [Aphelenchoides avenae]|nr:gagpol and env protein precursor [Aphelenchus avenae]
MAAQYNREAVKRALEIFERVLEGSQGKSVLESHMNEVLALFERFNDCFALTDFELSTTHLIEHDIELKDGLAKQKRLVLSGRLNPQEGRLYRMCVDHRELSKSLVGKKFFTTCDRHSGYWQIPLTPKAKELTAFSTMGGHWEFNVLPFG